MKNLYEYINEDAQPQIITEQMIDEGFFRQFAAAVSSKLAGKTADKARGVWKKISKGAETAKGNIGTYLNNKKEAVKQVWGDATEGILKIYNTLSTEVENAVGGAKEKLEELSTKAMETTTDIINNVKDGAAQAAYFAEAVVLSGKSVNAVNALKKYTKELSELSEKMNDETLERSNKFVEEYIPKDIQNAIMKFQ